MTMSPHLRILIIEDNADLTANLSDYFEEKGHTVDSALDGITGLHLGLVHDFDIIILDLMLPGLDGITLCQKLRQEGKKNTPILMLTARNSLDDKVAGFASGTDDYLVKPFALKELEMRIYALTKRASGLLTRKVLQVGDLEYNLETMQVRRANQLVELPAIPLRILELLMNRSPGVVWRHDIENTVWGDSPPDSDALRVHMHTLRTAIHISGKPPMLHTLRGVGYQLTVPDAA
ncbi:MAG: response regulator transcription factor [Magnetococcus sp. DMHC-6]